MKIVVSGGTGFIGEPLCESLLERGDLYVLTRDPSRVSIGRGIEWHPPEPGAWQQLVGDADVVINLAGENIAGGRWSEKKKKRLLRSRVDATRSIVDSIRDAPPRERRLLNASAVGFYGDRADTLLHEESSQGSGFLPDLAVEWEAAARDAEGLADVTVLRFGVVIGQGGGALSAMLPIFRFGLGGKLGSGEQWMSWVHRDDLIRLVNWLIDDRSRSGVYNVTSPAPVTNREFTSTLAEVLRRPAMLPAPAFGLRLILGEMADEMLLASQRVVPKHALDQGFEFAKPDLRSALESALG